MTLKVVIDVEGSDVVACVVVASGTVLGLLQIYLGGDGAIMAGLIGLYGTVLGYTFGRTVAKIQTEAAKTA